MASSTGTQKRIRRANPSTIHDKFIVGYQGWFTCAGDGEPIGPGHHGWLHWFNYPIPDGGRPNLDLWPDISSYSPSELYPAPGLRTKTGEPVFLFSSRNPQTVQRHFHWMAEHGIDGAFLQRFLGQTDPSPANAGIRKLRDEIGDHVRRAAELESRVFAIMYDVSGVSPAMIPSLLQQDWAHLVHEKRVLDSPSYLREGGRPVVGIWGCGLQGSGISVEVAREAIEILKRLTPGGGVYVFAGTPGHWRTGDGDAESDKRWLDVWTREVDAVSPWTVGRFENEREIEMWGERMKGDFELLKENAERPGGKRVDYIPVVFPGGSGYNLSEGKWAWNNIKRNGGRFLWKQIHTAKSLGGGVGVRTIYGAMWDEYDEGTAFMPAVPYKRLLPESHYPFMALDEDGHDLPPDWYMRICGFAAEVLHGERRVFETFPSKELQDYWATRPKYEEGSVSAPIPQPGSSTTGTTSTDEGAQSYDEWLAAQQGEGKEEEAPPPYTLEAPENASAPVTDAHPNAPIVAPTPVSTSTSTTPSWNSIQQQDISPGPPNTIAGVGEDAALSTLINDLGRASISGGSSPNPATNVSMNVGKHTRLSPPPVHPTHPAAASSSNVGYVRPVSSSGPRPPPLMNLSARPSSARPGSDHGYGYGQNQYQNQNTQAGGQWSGAQWPPPEWKTSQGGGQNSPHAVYSGGVGRGRPGKEPARPPSTTGAHGRPGYGGPGMSFPFPHLQGPNPAPGFVVGHDTGFGPSGVLPYPTAVTATSGPGNVSEQVGGGIATSSYPPYVATHIQQHQQGPPGGQILNFPSSPGQYHVSPPQSPHAATPSPGPAPGRMPGYSSPGGGPAAVSPYQPSYQRPASGHGPVQAGANNNVNPNASTSGAPYHFPQGSGSGSPSHTGEYGTYQFQQYPPYHQYQSHGHSQGQTCGPGSFPQASTSTATSGASTPVSTYNPYSSVYAQGPASSVHNGATAPGTPGPSYSNSELNASPWGATGPSIPGTPPLIPPRPSSSYSKPNSAPSFPVASTTGALGLARTAVDKVAGRKTRETWETQVGNLAQTGSKLLSKFTK